MELARLVYGLMCRNDSCMYGCKVAFLMYILIPFCRKCGWLCIFHEEFCEKDKFAYHIVDILRNLLFFMVYLLWTVLLKTLVTPMCPHTSETVYSLMFAPGIMTINESADHEFCIWVLLVRVINIKSTK